MPVVKKTVEHGTDGSGVTQQFSPVLDGNSSRDLEGQQSRSLPILVPVVWTPILRRD